MTIPKRTVFLHVDIDSTDTLLRFWGYGQLKSDLDLFYQKAMDRALALFDRFSVKGGFFCVGKELETCRSAARMILKAHSDGHEIGNHTYTHPYGFTKLPLETIGSEIERCSQAIKNVTGCRPAGFRAPSYDSSGRVIDLVRQSDFTYDSSAYWSWLLPLMKTRHAFFSKKKPSGEFGRGSLGVPRDPYYPGKDDWRRPGKNEGLLEIPLARSTCFGLPFYNNFHLMAGSAYRSMSLFWMNQPVLVYLIHLIEFVDLTDGIPGELRVHPNVKTLASKKIAFLEQTIRLLLKKYEALRADEFTRELARKPHAQEA